MRETLHSVNDEWQADGSLENPRALFRIWSALQFTFCVPVVGGGDLSIRELFGEGLSWAGCTFIHLLNQVDLYTAFDMNNHILSVQRAERKLNGIVLGVGGFGSDAAQGVAGAGAGGAGATGAGGGGAAGDGSGTAAALAAAGLRPDVVQFLESAVFYQNVNEEVFGRLACII
ncbi:cytoplasmic fragile-X interacting family-domain-containing protein [Blyttiomyces helicus]|uniref:Cytoplasmic fragile-X interacting family-domain-containing protein n=1 Tax=Blyttiomyces helicus TaxID=388810 RepID=A0A4V1IQ31_9FUNG|nr:cytoplasmic fragile-X interacting family-domain-containing protein [Blyttiomyces helicus]|eukprot:RKO85137.1 cytoplasmic fragile-X interacting family-domain-containing protein [Blyttiomyces helicus]